MSQLTEVDLARSLQLHNTSLAGRETRPGPHSPGPALHFSGRARAVRLEGQAGDAAATLLQSSKEFSFLTSIRQQQGNTGTIFALSYGASQAER